MTTLVKSNGNARNIFFPELPVMFDDFFTKEFFKSGLLSPNAGALPAVNVKENTGSYVVEVAVPGMDKNDFKIELKENTLKISAKKEKTEEDKADDGRYVRREFGFQSFTRSFTLPENMVDSENISASYKDGILSIGIPKKEKALETKEIRIS